MAQHLTSLPERYEAQQAAHPDWTPELNDVAYVTHGKGSDRDRIFTLGQIRDLFGSTVGIKVIARSELTYDAVRLANASDNIVVVTSAEQGGGSQTTVRKYWVQEGGKTGANTGNGFQFNRLNAAEMKLEVLSIDEEDAITSSEIQINDNTFNGLTVNGNAVIKKTSGNNDGNLTAEGSVFTKEEFVVIDNGGHPVGKARTKWKPDVIASSSIESSGFLLVESQMVDDYYDGREFVVFNTGSSDIHVRIFMVEWDNSTNKFKFVADSSASGVSGHKIMNVTVRPKTSRVLVYAGIYDSQNNNEGGFFAVE